MFFPLFSRCFHVVFPNLAWKFLIFQISPTPTHGFSIFLHFTVINEKQQLKSMIARDQQKKYRRIIKIKSGPFFSPPYQQSKFKVSVVLAWLASFMRETINEPKKTNKSKIPTQHRWNYMASQKQQTKSMVTKDQKKIPKNY